MSDVLRILKTAGPLMPGGETNDANPAPMGPPHAGGAAEAESAEVDDGDESDEDVPVVHSAGGTGIIITPDQMKQMHDILLGSGGEPHGLMIILPREGTDRAVHFNPIPMSAMETPDAAQHLLQQWEEAHGGAEGATGDGDGDGDGDDMGVEDDPRAGIAQHHAGPPPNHANPGVPETSAATPPVPPGHAGIKNQHPSNLRPNPAAQQAMPPKMAGFLAGYLLDAQRSSLEKTAAPQGSHGRGIAATIDALVAGKVAGSINYTLEEMMELIASSGKCDNEAAARQIGKKR